MENLFNFDFNGLRRSIYSLPLPSDPKLDDVTVQDIAGMAVYAIEHSDDLVGKTIDIASDSVCGKEVVEVLSQILNRPIHYVQMPIEQVRKTAGGY